MNTKSASRSSILLFTFIFALSGFSGLIYESIWSHYLKLFLGHSSYAQVLVLGIFMGGMALGAALVAKFSFRLRNLVLAYGICEGIIGLFGLGFHQLFVNVEALAFETIFPTLATSNSVHLVKWSIGALLILPQSILLGATFPLLATGLLRKFPSNNGRTLATLYFVNSFGAAIGILANAFWFIPKLGLPGAILTAGLINISIALAVYYYTKGDDFPEPKPSSTQGTKPVQFARTMFWVAALTGLASFMYEIAWIRMLTMVLGGSTHSFEIMLSAFILGLAIGSLLIRKHIDKITNPLTTLGTIQLIMGLLAALTIPLYNYTFEMMAFVKAGLAPTDPGYLFYSLFSLFISMVIMLPVTICAGTTLPLVTHILLRNGAQDRVIGKLYAFNTLGSIAGIALAAQFIMPWFGLKTVVVGGAIVDVALGLWLLSLHKEKLIATRGGRFALASVVAVGLLLSTFPLDTSKMASSVFRHGRLDTSPETNIIFHRDGKTSTVAIKENGNKRILLNNGKPDAGVLIRSPKANTTPDSNEVTPLLAAAHDDEALTQNGSKARSDEEPKKREPVTTTGDEPTMVLLGTLPYVYKPNANYVANIGLGSGVTTHTLLHHKGIEKLDTIEIEQAVVDATEFFRPNVDNIFTDDRSEIHIEDAKTFFATAQKTYDAIVSEPPNPWVSGVAGLFTVEFYNNIKRYLTSDGVLVQWIQLYEISPELVGTVYGALSAEFEYIHMYKIGNGDAAFVASQSPLEPDYSAPFQHQGFDIDLAEVNINGPSDILFRNLGNKTKLDLFFAPYTQNANSDYFPILDVGASKTRYKSESATSVYQLALSRGLDFLSNGSRPQFTSLSVDPTIQETVHTDDTYKMTQTFNGLVDGTYGKSYPETLWEKSAFSLHEVLSSCSGAGSTAEKNALSAELIEITKQAYTYSSKPSFGTLIDTFTVCKPFLNAEAASWIDTSLAWANEDMATVMQLSDKWLLNNEQPTSKAATQILLILNMTARAALGEWSGMEELERKYKGSFKGDMELTALFHLGNQILNSRGSGI